MMKDKNYNKIKLIKKKYFYSLSLCNMLSVCFITTAPIICINLSINNLFIYHIISDLLESIKYNYYYSLLFLYCLSTKRHTTH